MPLFDEYLNNNKISDALLVGRNMVNKEPQNQENFCKYIDLLLSLAEKLPLRDERRQFANQAGITLAFFEENAELNSDTIELINQYHSKVNKVAALIADEDEAERRAQDEHIRVQNDDTLKKLYREQEKLKNVSNQKELDEILIAIAKLDAHIDHDMLTEQQELHYNQLNKSYTALISKKMSEIERNDNIEYNRRAADAFATVFDLFRKDENRYKKQAQLLALTSKLFAFDASRLFTETLIYYNHIYSYIFSKLDDDGKLALTKHSIECERKLR